MIIPMISAILSSKMYKSSSRKNKINSAYNDPLNSELVQQLESYLYTKDDSDKVESIIDNDKDDSRIIRRNSSSTSRNTSIDDTRNLDSYTDDNISKDLYEDSDSEITENAVGDASSIIDKDSNEPDKDETLQEQSDISESSKVLASDKLDLISSESLELMRNTLNSRSDTCGISRISIKDLELWIYYNDKINLNNIMLPCIESLNSMGYTYLEFSRLARSDNAIVFDINQSSENSVKSIKEIVDEEKEA